MIFRRIIVSALVIGLLIGLLLSMAQTIMVNPMTFLADNYKITGHSDNGRAWATEGDSDRAFYNVFGIVISLFALVTLSITAVLHHKRIAFVRIEQNVIRALTNLYQKLTTSGMFTNLLFCLVLNLLTKQELNQPVFKRAVANKK